jgi:hypothetical protein
MVGVETVVMMDRAPALQVVERRTDSIFTATPIVRIEKIST